MYTVHNVRYMYIRLSIYLEPCNGFHCVDAVNLRIFFVPKREVGVDTIVVNGNGDATFKECCRRSSTSHVSGGQFRRWTSHLGLCTTVGHSHKHKNKVRYTKKFTTVNHKMKTNLWTTQDMPASLTSTSEPTSKFAPEIVIKVPPARGPNNGWTESTDTS